MKKRFFLAACLCLAALAGAETVNLSGAPWELTLGGEFKGATGEMTVTGKGDQSVITTVSDFSKGGNYTGIVLPLKPPRDIQELSFRISSPAKHVAVQIEDSTGQNFVRFLPLSGSRDNEQTVTVERFRVPGNRESAYWGGPNDGTVRPPFRKLTIRTLGSSAGDTSRPQTIRISEIKIRIPDQNSNATVYSPKPDDFHLNLGGEFPGAAGDLKVEAEQIVIRSDFSNGGNYIGAFLDFPNGINAQSLDFKVKTPFPFLMIEVGDAKGQHIHQTVRLSGKEDEWQTVSASRLQSPGNKAFGYWGGDNNGELVMPVKRIIVRWLTGSAPALKKFDTALKEFSIVSVGAVPSQEQPPSTRIPRPEQLIAPPGGAPAEVKLSRRYEKATVKYSCRNYTGLEIIAGELPVVGGELIRLPIPAKVGFYEYSIPELNFTAGMIAIPRFEGKRDDFFAIDAAMSVFPVFRDAGLAESYLTILENSGVGIVRERLLWKQIEQEGPGAFDFSRLNSDGLRKLAEKHGLKVLDVFHDAPAWSGANTNRLSNDFNPFPRNLVQAASSWRKIGEQWEKHWNGLEVWNEPEIAFGASMPGDQVMALQRTISYEFADAGIQTPLIGGVFTGTISNDRMMRLYLRNGMLSDADCFSIHCYADADKMIRVISDFRHALRNDPKQAIPMWITECGKPWLVGTVRANANDDLFSAVNIAMKGIESKAGGVAVYFPFIFQFYEENANNFGMMDRNHTPMRSLAGYLNLADLLPHYRYAGDLTLKTGGKLNRVFLNGNKAIIAVYTGDQRTAIKLPDALKINAVKGIDGRELPLKSEYIERDGLLYLFATKQAVLPYLNTDTEAARLLALAESYRPVPRVAKPVVMQFDFDRSSTSWVLYGYLFNDPASASLPILFNNLSEKPLTIKPQLNLSEGVKVLTPLPAEITIPPRDRIRHTLRLDLSGGYAKTEELDLEIRDLTGCASPLLIGAKNWNLETVEATSGLSAARPEKFSVDAPKWTALETPTRWKKWEGGHLPNIRAAFHITFDADTMQIQVLVEDRKFHQPYPINQAWRADSVQFALQTLDSDGRRKQPFTEISAAHTPQGDKLYRHSCESGKKDKKGELKLSQLEFQQNPDGMLYTIRLNAKELEIEKFASGMRFGFALLVNSSEGKQRDGYLFWGDGIGENKNAREFNILQLK